MPKIRTFLNTRDGAACLLNRHSNLLRALMLAVLVGEMSVAVTGRRVRPQCGEGTPLPVMSAERAWAFVQAAERKLHYLPGEVLVKFTISSSAGAQQRALTALRSRPAATDQS